MRYGKTYRHGSAALSMARSHYGPAAGASGGAPVRDAEIWLPEFLRFDRAEMVPVIGTGCRTTIALYWLVVAHSDFSSGEFLGGYARLIALLTPPAPRRGPRPAGPTMWEVRKAVDNLVKLHVLRRGTTNAEQGQLRLFCHPRDEEAAKRKRAAKAAREAAAKALEARKKAR